MTYDHWKATNPADEWLGPDPDEEARKEAEEERAAARADRRQKSLWEDDGQ